MAGRRPVGAESWPGKVRSLVLAIFCMLALRYGRIPQRIAITVPREEPVSKHPEQGGKPPQCKSGTPIASSLHVGPAQQCVVAQTVHRTLTIQEEQMKIVIIGTGYVGLVT